MCVGFLCLIPWGLHLPGAQKAALPGFIASFSTSSVSSSDFPESHLAGSEARTGAWEDGQVAAFRDRAQLTRLRGRGLADPYEQSLTAPEGWRLEWAWGAGC